MQNLMWSEDCTRLAGVPEEFCLGVRQVHGLHLTRWGEVGFAEENTKTQFLVVEDENERPTCSGPDQLPSSSLEEDSPA